MNVPSNILDDLEFGDVVHFRNGGLGRVTFLTFEPMPDGSEMACINFNDEPTEWYYDTSGSLFLGEVSGFDIVKVTIADEITELFRVSNDK